jgi:hypothetical protein
MSAKLCLLFPTDIQFVYHKIAKLIKINLYADREAINLRDASMHKFCNVDEIIKMISVSTKV